MGFERILSVLQGKSSNYDTDLFTPIFALRLEELLTGKTYGGTIRRPEPTSRSASSPTTCAPFTAAFADGVTAVERPAAATCCAG